MTSMTESLTFADSIHISTDPMTVYRTVADVTRAGEWSPICRECWWDEGDGPRVGAWFTGRNVTPDREWQTRSRVVVADEGRAFGWSVGPGRVIWTYNVQDADGGTLLTESWEFLPEGQEFFAEKYGARASEEIAARTASAQTGIPETLAAIKQVVEAR